jgi:hypothetical protein
MRPTSRAAFLPSRPCSTGPCLPLGMLLSQFRALLKCCGRPVQYRPKILRPLPRFAPDLLSGRCIRRSIGHTGWIPRF